MSNMAEAAVDSAAPITSLDGAVAAMLRGVQVGFDSMTTRFDAQDARIGAIEARMDGLEAGLGSLGSRMDTTDTRLADKEVLDQRYP
jgi:hypothetical protein